MVESTAPRYGALAERHARDRLGLSEAESGRSWRDARSTSGRSVEIKAAMRERSNGSEGRFTIFRSAHRDLARNDGVYAFVVYQPAGRGIDVRAIETVDARALRGLSWSSSQHETDGREQRARIPISDLF